MHRIRRALCMVITLWLAWPPVTVAAQDTPPLRLADELEVPEWVRLSMEHRTRVETIQGQFRANRPGSDSALSTRTRVFFEAMPTLIGGGVELADSRIYLTDSNTALNNGLGNALDVLQLYVRLHHEWEADQSSIDVRAGRVRMDLAGRHLIAWNRFRNTMNAFTGVDIEGSIGGQHTLRAFVVSPVIRRPALPAGIEANRMRADEEAWNDRLWGLAWGMNDIGAQLRSELYLIGFHENEGDRIDAPDRRLFTPGGRVVRAPSPGTWDMDVEVMAQFGQERIDIDGRAQDVAHRAFSTFARIGYMLDQRWRPRFVLVYDYASGDGDSGDQTVGRFDPLFGIPPASLNPTGLYGAFRRANINSPGLRFDWTVPGGPNTWLRYRAVWLASANDGWSGSGIGAPTNPGNTFLGHQADLRTRWTLARDVVHIDAGGVLFKRDGVATNGDGANPEPWTGYLYFDLYLRF